MDQLNESQLRRCAEIKGYAVSGRQFRDFQHWGLIPAPDSDKRWVSNTVNTLVRIRELGERVRSLPRRVILLGCDGFLIPGDRLKAAMYEVAPVIRQPVRTMRRIARARCILTEPAAAKRSDAEWRAWEQSLGAMPEPSQWQWIISQSTPDGVARRFNDRWYLSTLWMRERTRNTTYDVSDIPLEEMLTVLAVLNIADVLTASDSPASPATTTHP